MHLGATAMEYVRHLILIGWLLKEVIFKQAYTSSPVCSPSRASLISGQYPHNHGVLINTHIAPAWTGGLGENKITFITTLQ